MMLVRSTALCMLTTSTGDVAQRSDYSRPEQTLICLRCNWLATQLSHTHAHSEFNVLVHRIHMHAPVL